MAKVLRVASVFFIGLFLAGAYPHPAQAKDWTDCVVGTGQVATLQCIPIVFENVINAALALAGVVAIFMIIYSGIRFVVSSGDPKAVEGARNTLTWAVIGLIVILLSFAIVSFIGFFTGATCINKFGFNSCPTAS